MHRKFQRLIENGVGKPRHLPMFMLVFALIAVSQACSLSSAGKETRGDQVATSVAQTEDAQREMDLAVTGTVMAQSGELTATLTSAPPTVTPRPITPTVTAQPITPTVTPRPITPTNTPTARVGVTIDFDALPDGSVIDGDIILDGNEFSSQGVLLAGNPVSSYCSDAKSSAIEVPPYASGIPFDVNYLTTALAGDHTTCSTVPVRVDFVELVSKVEVEFIGCEKDYYLRVLDDTGEPLGTSSEMGMLDQHTTVSYSASAENISAVIFGRELCKTMVKEIYFEH